MHTCWQGLQVLTPSEFEVREALQLSEPFGEWNGSGPGQQSLRGTMMVHMDHGQFQTKMDETMVYAPSGRAVRLSHL